MGLAAKTLAACDEDLPALLRDVIPEMGRRAGDIRRIDGGDPLMSCSCRRPADWYVRLYEPDPTPQENT